VGWEKGQEGRAALDELAESWLQAVGWIHAMSDAERLELARRTAYMHLIASAAAAAAAAPGSGGISVPLQAVPPTFFEPTSLDEYASQARALVAELVSCAAACVDGPRVIDRDAPGGPLDRLGEVTEEARRWLGKNA